MNHQAHQEHQGNTKLLVNLVGLVVQFSDRSAPIAVKLGLLAQGEDQAMAVASLIHLFVLAFIVVIVATPVATILKRLGFSPWWVILFFIPLVNLIGLWVVSRVRWPKMPTT